MIGAKSENNFETEYGVKVVGVPVLNDAHTGTAILLVKKNGGNISVWLLEDETLYIRFPGKTCYYFVRK